MQGREGGLGEGVEMGQHWEETQGVEVLGLQWQ